ncbi:MAG: bifunctional diaminohydroxyphosphoribosylaminopyrimidine deaminase/5-amino-6-(5-phosphoribosylamino)uracil reductase RibD [Alphaproteobacteria bacterium]|nr:bifunctional diaminohydroxyphosphoribosylaminopyrimidine deaminase/5-amino-6-(5-phosphoribosylamino)uracil reductase RibD [Alphaproteobacteria bacterium]MDP6588380.1 bifunctional diaminohydroxyphosphoribosylaminopyrimidine deaminase/5-amino-6-(5-phosphoribosylamino)uracil reductase RibD [Alphaproteobacteria bacterium]MDP6817115.1 bifunctional diaminohydroxyphosphoribosylaminopyrimidine deaminase/5-amino-6-(5-phosphoribosylamino)uracil reductase RibD [Alphaproteobacteria bacterium]
MAAALALGERGLGAVWPNPAVGCVLVRSGRVVGRGWTQAGGRPHAESEALRRAGAAAAGATAYVTLEPCAHHGRTPPCAEALIEARIARLVAAMADPDARVSGRGFKLLEAAGIEVAVGTAGEAAARLNAGYLSRVESGRPLVTLKLATSLDGRIATRGGESKWITGESSRARGHLLRARNDAILVGSGTALADDPSLTCRLPGLEHRSPVRVVMDGRLRLPPGHQLVARARQVPTWIVTLGGADAARRKSYRAAGAEVIEVAPDRDGHPDAAATLKALGERGITRLLVEGGAHIAAAMLGAGLVDRLVCFRAPSIIGADGAPAAQSFALDRLADAPSFVRRALSEAGGDVHESFDSKA